MSSEINDIRPHNLDTYEPYVIEPQLVGKFVLDANNILLGPLTVGETYHVVVVS